MPLKKGAKSTMLNKIHQQFAIAKGFSLSVVWLWGWILRRADKNKPSEIEIDTKKFNKEYVAPRRPKGEFHRTTIQKAIAFLDEHGDGAVTILKNYNHGVYRILVRPLSFVENKNLKVRQKSQTQNAKPMYSEEQKARIVKQQQQRISKIKDLLAKVNIKFDPDGLSRLWKLAGKKVENIVQSVELLLYRHQTKPIPNPQGFLIDCLKFKWHEGFDPYYEPELPKFETKQDLIQFSNSLRDGVT